jgi:hypothetical protein
MTVQEEGTRAGARDYRDSDVGAMHSGKSVSQLGSESRRAGRNPEQVRSGGEEAIMIGHLTMDIYMLIYLI